MKHALVGVAFGCCLLACGADGTGPATTQSGLPNNNGAVAPAFVPAGGVPAGMNAPVAGASVDDVDQAFTTMDATTATGDQPGPGASLIGLPPGVPAAADTMAVPSTPGPADGGPPATAAAPAGGMDAMPSAGMGAEASAGAVSSSPMMGTPDMAMAPAMGSPLNEADVLFREDFEAGTVGQTPSGWDTFIAWNANANNNPQGNVFALVADNQVHAGEKALHVSGGGNPAQLTRPLPEGTTRLHVRAYVRMSRKLGQNPGANHETLFAIRGIPGAAHDEVRFGEIKGVIGTNEVPSDNISPLLEQWGKGPVVPADTWACIEVAFIADQMPHQLRAWVDGELVHEVTDPSKDFQNGPLGDEWLSGHFKEVVIGWHSFSGQDAEVWFDDVVVSRSAIGC